MSNSNRNPKELKELVEKCKTNDDDSDFFEKSMKNLRNLSQEDKTEMGMLKSRIDEQSRLIMILKQRCDDFIRKNMALEKLNQDLMNRNDELSIDNEDLKRKEKDFDNRYSILEKRFESLAENHEEMIKLKDEYKFKSINLSDKNKKLLDQMKCMVNEDEASSEKTDLLCEIETLNRTIKENKKNFMDHLKRNEDYINELKENSSQNDKINQDKINFLNNKIDEYRNQIQNLKNEVIENENKFKNLNEHNSESFKKLSKEKDEIQLACRKLGDEKESIAKSLKHMEDKYHRLTHELGELNSNQVIKNLRNDIMIASKRYSDLEAEFAAYKEYASNLLAKEKEINSKLQFLIS